MTNTAEDLLTAATTAATTDYVRLVTGIGGTPVSKDMTLANLITFLTANWPLPLVSTARASTTTTWTNNTTLSGVTGLSIVLVAGHHYAINAKIFTTAGSGGGLKLSLGGTVTPTDVIYNVYIGANGQSVTNLMKTSLNSGTGQTSADCFGSIDGFIDVSVGGTLTVLAAQNGSNGTPTISQIGSYLIVTDMS
jgi:hypothetical protein